MAQSERSIAAVYHDPFANVHPEGAGDEVWFVNDKNTPPTGTPVKVIVKKNKK